MHCGHIWVTMFAEAQQHPWSGQEMPNIEFHFACFGQFFDPVVINQITIKIGKSTRGCILKIPYICWVIHVCAAQNLTTLFLQLKLSCCLERVRVLGIKMGRPELRRKLKLNPQYTFHNSLVVKDIPNTWSTPPIKWMILTMIGNISDDIHVNVYFKLYALSAPPKFEHIPKSPQKILWACHIHSALISVTR